MTTSWTEDVNEATFEEKVISVSKSLPVLVDFWAPWCGPCRQLGPILERMVDTYQGKVRLAKLNTDENPNLAARYRIQGIPAVKAFIDGEVADEFVGVLPEQQVREFVELLIPSESDRLAKQAKELETEDPTNALRLYQEALSLDPQHPPSLVGTLRLLLQTDRIEEAQSLFSQLPGALEFHPEVPRLKALLDLAAARRSGRSVEELQACLEQNPESLDARWDLAVRLASDGQYRQALEAYLWIVKKDRSFKDDGARRAMLQIFEVTGVRSSLAEEFREKLAQTIF